MIINDKYLEYSILESLKQKENYKITESDLPKIKQISCQYETKNYGFLANLPNLEELTINLHTHLSNQKVEAIDFSFLKSLKKLNKIKLIDCDIPEELLKAENLKTLIYWNSGEIPDIIGKLTQLTALDIRKSNKAEYPKSIGKLKNLESLSIEADVFIEFIGDLTELKTLNIDSNKREKITIPDLILKLEKLAHLELRFFNEIVFPENLGMLKNIKSLNFYGSKTIENIDVISKLENLEDINFEFTELKHLPENIGNLKKIKILKFRDQNFAFPESIGNMTGLKKLEMFSGKISNIPESFSNLENLEEIDFHYTKISKLPESIGNLKKLKKLRISDSGITHIPDSIGNCENLEKLDIERNEISSLPDSICNLKKLKYIDISVNNIKSLPENIGNLKKLQTYYGNFDKAPASFGNLTELKQLAIGGARIKNLPDYFANFTKLEKLNLAYSSIETIPEYFTSFDKLKELNLSSMIGIISFPEELFFKDNLKIIGYKYKSKDDFRRPEDMISNLEETRKKDKNMLSRISFLKNYKKISEEIEIYLDNDACEDEDFNDDLASYLKDIHNDLCEIFYVKFRKVTSKKLKEIFTHILQNNTCKKGNNFNIYLVWSLTQAETKLTASCSHDCFKSDLGSTLSFPDFDVLNKMHKEAHKMDENNNYVLTQFKEITINKFSYIINDILNDLQISNFFSELQTDFSFTFYIHENKQKPQPVFEYTSINPEISKAENYNQLIPGYVILNSKNDADYENALDQLLRIVMYYDEKFPPEMKNTQIVFCRKTDNNFIPIENYSFINFSEETEPIERLNKKLQTLIRFMCVTYVVSENKYLFINEIFHFASLKKEYVKYAILFFKEMDFKYEAQIDKYINQLIEAHNYTAETIELLLGRTKCYDKLNGYEFYLNHLKNKLGEWLKNEKNLELFLNQLAKYLGYNYYYEENAIKIIKETFGILPEKNAANSQKNIKTATNLFLPYY